MTKQDFELIASILADAESKIENDIGCTELTREQTAYGMEILNSIVANFAGQLEDQYPRFKPELFTMRAFPIHNYRLKQRILDKLAKHNESEQSDLA